MKLYPLALFLVSTVVVYAEDSATSLAMKFMALPKDQMIAQNLPKGREDEVARQIARLGGIDTLLRLNHQPSVDKFIGNYVTIEGKSEMIRGAIERSESPYLFDELAPMLYKDEAPNGRYYGESSKDFGESAQTAILFGRLIQNAPQFSDEQKRWAKENLVRPTPELIKVARAWWEVNRASLSANRFEGVVVPSTSDIERVASSALSGSDTFSVARAEVSTTPTTLSEKPTIVGPTPEIKDDGTTSDFPIFKTGIGVLILTVLFILVRRKRSA